MNKNIQDITENCEVCLMHKKSNTKQPLILRELPDGPWSKVGVDLYYYKEINHILVVDYFSKYIETEKLENMSSQATIRTLKSIFARHGIPDEIFSDNATQFSSKEFKEFAKSWNIKHTTSSPTFAQSNGMVERHIGIFKQMMRKCEHDDKDPYLALLELRNTPISNDLKSPNELLYGRKVNGLLPILKTKREMNEIMRTKDKLNSRQMTYKKFYDKNAHELKDLKKNEKVFIKRNKKTAEAAKVLDQCQRPRSYKLEFEDGLILERNRKDIIKGPVIIEKHQETPKITSTSNSMERSSEEEKQDKLSEKESTTQCLRKSSRPTRKPEYLKDFVTY